MGINTKEGHLSRMYIYQGILHEPEYDPENKVLVYVRKSVRNAIWQFGPKLLSVDIICLT